MQRRATSDCETRLNSTHATLLFTLIECARRRGIDPFVYLRDALTRLPRMSARQLDELMPGIWISARKAD